MTSRAKALLAVPLAAGATVLGLPALGSASSGGGGLSASTRSSASPSASNPHSGNGMVSASANGVAIVTRDSAFLHGQLRFSGRAPASDAGRVVQIQRLGHQTRWGWASTVRARVRGDGSFSAVWQVNHIGRFAIRAVVGGGGAGAASASPTVMVIVYRLAIATTYGPGFYGSTTACGEVLGRRTLGVANRTLPCGTPVAIYYQGRTMVVPVIDRGPYANGADWDLTEIAARKLGIDGTATIGAVSLPRRR